MITKGLTHCFEWRLTLPHLSALPLLEPHTRTTRLRGAVGDSYDTLSHYQIRPVDLGRGNLCPGGDTSTAFQLLKCYENQH